MPLPLQLRIIKTYKFLRNEGSTYESAIRELSMAFFKAPEIIEGIILSQ